MSTKKELKFILKNWDLDKSLDIMEENIEYKTDREKHIWGIGEKYILKMNRNEEQIKKNINISTSLLEENIPVQRVVTTKYGELYFSLDKKYYVLFNKLQGDALKDYFEGDYLKRAAYLGECLAELHKGLFNLSKEVNLSKEIMDGNIIEELNGWVKCEIDLYLDNCDLSECEKLEFINSIEGTIKNFSTIYNELPRQLIHRDFHGENMIFENEKLVGYIDFDLTQINARIFDLCYLCTGALATIFNDEEKREKWIEFSKSFIKGYDIKLSLNESEKLSLKNMMLSIELIMIAFFAKEGYRDIAFSNIKMFNWINESWNYK
ncbi:phosphotransferase enzyme family protein [Clostridium sp. B9]|uniref:phosphotransferase enzyme family protein n=1 Tax=Clostridium sp. B9 TaxID=3423224 RepID=UPI003D2EA778